VITKLSMVILGGHRLRGPSRRADVCARRRKIARWLYFERQWTQERIGRLFGRDRSTVARWLWHEGWLACS